MPDSTSMSDATRAILAMIVWSPFYILPTAIACVGARLFVRSRPRPPLTLEDWLLFVVPWFVWFSAMILNSNHKSLANLAEAYVLIVVAVVGFTVRFVVGPRFEAPPGRSAVLVGVCSVGLALAFLVPPLPE